METNTILNDFDKETSAHTHILEHCDLTKRCEASDITMFGDSSNMNNHRNLVSRCLFDFRTYVHTHHWGMPFFGTNPNMSSICVYIYVSRHDIYKVGPAR